MADSKIIRFGEKQFLCRLISVKVKGGKTTEKVFCREIKDGEEQQTNSETN